MIKRKIDIEGKNRHIWTVHDAVEHTFLLKKVPVFVYTEYEKKEIRELVKHMRKAMSDARGIGLSANQMGFSLRLCIAQLPAQDGSGYTGKFYALINPHIVSHSTKKTIDEEGCLSIPCTYGAVARFEKIVVSGLDMNGREVRIHAQGLLARIFQHEIDHLDGVLFTRKAKDIYILERNANSIAKG